MANPISPMCKVSANQSNKDNFLSLIHINGYSIRNKPIMVTPVQNPIFFRESRACSTAPVLTSEAISNIFKVASKPGNGRGSSTSQTRLKIMKYITPKKPANILATIPINARLNASPSAKLISGPLANSYLASEARRKIAGKVKIKPVDA